MTADEYVYETRRRFIESDVRNRAMTADAFVRALRKPNALDEIEWEQRVEAANSWERAQRR